MASFTLTAGHTFSLPSVLIGEGIIRAGHEVRSILMVSPWQYRRFRDVLKQRGLKWVTQRLGFPASNGHPVDSRLRKLSSEMAIKSSRVKSWAAAHRIQVKVVDNLNSYEALTHLRQVSPDAVIYSGGGILREQFISEAGIVLNAHAGPLPEIRGMNAAEWAFLLGARREITIHRIDQGIDTGARVSVRALEEPALDVNDLRDLAVSAGVKEMIRVISEDRWRDTLSPASIAKSRQCFVLAAAIQDILNERLRVGV